MALKLFILILNWNQKDDTLECLDSLLKVNYPDYKVIVVDNASSDASQEAIKKTYPKVVLIENEENLGYVGGNNVGIKHALEQGADYIFVLNNDTAVDAKALSFLIEEIEKDKNIGITGPKIYFYDEKNKIQSMGGMLDKSFNPTHRGVREIDSGQFNKVKEVDFISGSAMMIKKEVFEKIGLFDEQFFMYWDETDFCYRVQKAGFKIIVVPDAKIWHKGGGAASPLITYYMARNKLLFLKKHKLGTLNILKTYIANLRTILSWTLKPKWNSKRQERNSLIRALCDFSLGRKGKAHFKNVY